MRATKKAHIEVECNRASIRGNVDDAFITLSIPSMKFEGDKINGYSYSNWCLFDLKDLADGLYEFLRLHEKGKELLNEEKP